MVGLEAGFVRTERDNMFSVRESYRLPKEILTVKYQGKARIFDTWQRQKCF